MQEGRGTGCDKFVWIEKPLTGFHKELVQDLRDAVWDKKEEIHALEREIQELCQAQGRQEQGGGETDGLKIRPNSGNNFLIIWALSVAFVVYVAMSLSSS